MHLLAISEFLYMYVVSNTINDNTFCYYNRTTGFENKLATYMYAQSTGEIEGE